MSNKHESGQAIIVLALVLVVLLAFAALAVDAGNAYTERRESQNAADAAALAGARQLAIECASANPSEERVRKAAREMIALNNPSVDLTSEDDVQIHFLADGQSGVAPTGCVVGSCGGVNCDCNERYVGVDVKVVGKTDSFLAGLFGQDVLSAEAGAWAQYGAVDAFETGVYPITRRYDSSLQYNQQIKIRITEDLQSDTPGNFGWLRWPEQNGGAPTLATSLTPPGDSWRYENPGTIENNWNDANPNDHVIATGKWVRGRTGNVASVRPQLENLIDNNITIIIPLYDAFDGNGNNAKFRVAAFAAFEMECYHISNGQVYGNCIHTGDSPSDKWVEGIFKKWVIPSGSWGNIPCEGDKGVWSVKLVPAGP